VIELYGINTSFEDAEDAEADQTIYYWLDGLGLGRRQARAEVSRWLYFQNSRSNYFVEIEESDCCCKIDYRRKKPTVIARSTTEAEYLACSEATREAQGLIYLHRDVTGETVVPLIHCDSNGALSTIRSTITSDKPKHIDVPFHNYRHLDAAGVVKFTEIDTLENVADVMTKALPPEKHQYLTHGIGLRSFR